MKKKKNNSEEICANCGKIKGEHTIETTRRHRKDVKIIYCYSVDDYKQKKVSYEDFLNKKFK